MKKKAKVIIGVCAVTGVVCAAYFLGKKRGVAEFVQDLIDTYENHNGKVSSIEWPVFETNNKSMPGFMYEIKVECIGD